MVQITGPFQIPTTTFLFTTRSFNHSLQSKFKLTRWPEISLQLPIVMALALERNMFSCKRFVFRMKTNGTSGDVSTEMQGLLDSHRNKASLQHSYNMLPIGYFS